MRGPFIRELLIELVILLAVTLAVALMGPFGTFALGGLVDRLGYWALMIFGGYALVRPLMLVTPVLARRLDFPEGAVWTAMVLLGAAPVTLLVWFGGGGREMPTVRSFLMLYPNVALLGGLVALLFWFRRNRRVKAAGAAAGRASEAAAVPDPSAAEAAPAGPAILARLPAHRRGRLRALEMEDHYVRVHTDQGTHMLLMRMRDAVAETAPLAGEQVHRSWWVARNAVVGQGGDGRNLRLKLEGGLEAPVARNSVPRLKGLGWIR